MDHTKMMVKRYFRKVIAFPEGKIVHHGDCHIYSLAPVCTCGLLHDLDQDSHPEETYPEFWKDWDKQEDTFERLER